MKISCYTSLIAQKRENGAILGGYDVIGGPRGIGRENFEKVKFGQNFYFEKTRGCAPRVVVHAAK